MDSDNESYSERKAVIVLALEYAPAAFECFFTLRFYAISKSFALNFGSFIERKKKKNVIYRPWPVRIEKNFAVGLETN